MSYPTNSFREHETKREQVIRMAREAHVTPYILAEDFPFIERLITIAQAEQREKSAELVMRLIEDQLETAEGDSLRKYCAAAIRNQGEQE